jgi:uncharacterized protein YdhG (YjbR/CyaY superfamily)
MEMIMNKDIKDIDTYISIFPKDIQTILEQVRKTIKQEAPAAKETIKYGMPTFVLNGNLVFFAAFKNHIGFYATPTGHEEFKKELSPYKSGKGSVQFPLNLPIPFDIITKIVRFRVKENQEKTEKKNPNDGFLSLLSAPARRALENNEIKTLAQLAKFSEKEILEFHGMSKNSIPKLKEALAGQGLKFKSNFN